MNDKKFKENIKNGKVELLAPAGSHAMLSAAINAGADAVYFGLDGFNMRATAKNFKIEEIDSVVSLCHERDVKAYLTLNTIIYQEEIPLVKHILKKTHAAGIDAVICWDFAVIREAKKLDMEIHISTQAGISNSDAAEFYKSTGASRCVLARECSLEHIKEIRTNSSMGIEVFVHGAMCISVSGRCFLSQFLYGRSANRGDCLQPCRRAYETYLIRDRQEGKELILGNDYILSPGDLCTLPFLDKLLPHTDSLKIEGRARNPEYVYTVVKTYREAIAAIENGNFTEEFINSALDELKKVYNRGFSSGFYLGKPVNAFTEKPNSQSTRRKLILGRVTNFYKNKGVAEISVTANSVKTGDEILIIGPTTGVVHERVLSMEKNYRKIPAAVKGDTVGIKLSGVVRRNDSVFLWQDRN